MTKLICIRRNYGLVFITRGCLYVQKIKTNFHFTSMKMTCSRQLRPNETSPKGEKGLLSSAERRNNRLHIVEMLYLLYIGDASS